MTALSKIHKLVAKPRFWIWLHGMNILFWFGMTVVVPMTNLADSVAYVAVVSNLALALAEVGAWQAARAEAANPSADDIANRVVELLEERA